MNMDFSQTVGSSNDRRSMGPGRRPLAKETLTGAMPGLFLVMAALCVAVSVPLLFTTGGPMASLTLCAAITVVSGWYVAYNTRIYGGLTCTSCFVAVSAFVFVARGIYVSLYNDFDILTALIQPPQHHMFTNALVYVLYGALAFILGALLLERKTVVECEKSRAHPRIILSLITPKLSLLFIGLQVVFAFLLHPYGTANVRASLADESGSAYVYLLPTLIHGINLYIFGYLVTSWVRKRGTVNFLVILVSTLLMVLHAYYLYNMSDFRGFYVVGLFAASIVFILARFGKVPVFLLLVIFGLYPLFKSMGSDRSLSNRQIVDTVLLSPQESYNSDGIERAFGANTDLNMLDTLVASLNTEHKFHPYVLSSLYVFVHWVPRSIWPSKPRFGVLADISYQQGLPFSPGIIGFFNDDGGKIYMIIAMGFLGALFKWCERVTFRIRWQELYLCVWSALFLTALVTVRYLPYQAFYGFLVFFVPCFLLNWCVRSITGQTRLAVRRVKGNRRADPQVVL